MTTPFAGFQSSAASTFALYEAFVTDLLPLIDDADELKITLYALWAIQQREGKSRYLLRRDFTANTTLIANLSGEPEAALDAALERACKRGSLIAETLQTQERTEQLYFVNDAQGRTAASQVRAGQWLPQAGELPVEVLPPRPTVYALYEQNIGALTPMIRDELLAAQQDFPADWLEEAMRLAVAGNKRNWRYVRAILDRWKKEGKQNETPARSDAEAERRISRDLSDFILR